MFDSNNYGLFFYGINSKPLNIFLSEPMDINKKKKNHKFTLYINNKYILYV